MIEKIDEKIEIEAKKLLEKETLTTDEIQVLLSIKNDLKFKENMKTMLGFAS